MPRSKLLRPKLLRRLVISAWALSVAWLLGRLLVTSPWPAVLVSYVPPAAALTLHVASVAALLAVEPRRRALAAAGALAALGLGAYIAAVDMRFAGDDPAPSPGGRVYQLVHWNVFHDLLPWRAKIERLRRLEADVYVLNELPRHVTRGETALRLGPGFTYAFGGINGIGCRGKVVSQSFESHHGLDLLWADCEMAAEGDRLRILAVDMPASPLEARGPLLVHLFARIEEHRPDLVAGDFNTPRRAHRLRRPPAGYRHAYESVGGGWPYTWPAPLPMLAIDQCLAGPRLEPLDLRYVMTLSSDHVLQVLDFSATRTGDEPGLTESP